MARPVASGYVLPPAGERRQLLLVSPVPDLRDNYRDKYRMLIDLYCA
ncbi:hypothetical protein DF3PB_90012 [uncultured Defluviicoccus sp.]|uniref:Uncharacterized protein n=1 Tax=metagenome TaxID=256318 RepID=A0A380TK43_9ZZZZ|nr:hypothetical protein DF3PB_90012 [uncultured Defluviicoccus sp.]